VVPALVDVSVVAWSRKVSFSPTKAMKLSKVFEGSNSRGSEIFPDDSKVLVIEVTDTGVGLEPENLGKLFQEFVQINAANLQNGGGSGLGLMLTKGIVEQHGGRVGVYSEGLGKGCSFVIELPLVMPDDPNALENALPRQSSISKPRRLSVMNTLLNGSMRLIPHNSSVDSSAPPLESDRRSSLSSDRRSASSLTSRLSQWTGVKSNSGSDTTPSLDGGKSNRKKSSDKKAKEVSPGSPKFSLASFLKDNAGKK
jgi:hypothetical protein